MYRKYPSDLFRQGDRIYQQQLHPHSEMTVPYRPLPPVPTETRGENGFKTQESNVSSVNKKDTSNTKVKKRFFLVSDITQVLRLTQWCHMLHLKFDHYIYLKI